jgi:hypothetical protein
MMLDAGYWMLDIRRALAMPIVGIRLFLFAMIIFYPLVNPALAAPEFKMADALTCTIETSSNPDEIGRKISLSGLKTATPLAIFESHIRSSMVKLFESDKTLVMQLVATVSGSVDTIVIDKLTGRFAHTAAGAFLTDVHAVAETGSCRSE